MFKGLTLASANYVIRVALVRTLLHNQINEWRTHTTMGLAVRFLL